MGMEAMECNESSPVTHQVDDEYCKITEKYGTKSSIVHVKLTLVFLLYSPEKHGELFVMELLAKRRMTQVDVKAVTKATTDLVNNAVAEALNDCKQSLLNEGCRHTEAIDQVKANYSLFGEELFSSVNNQHSQLKVFVQKYGMILPEELELPPPPPDKVPAGMDVDEKHTYVIVPILKQLEKLLNRKDIYDEVFSFKQSVIGVYSRFEDGSSFKNNILFQTHPHALQIILYLDEVQICDPIGSYVYNNKLVFVYFTLGNLKPEHRSSFSNIFLISIYYCHLADMYTTNRMLKPIIDDIKKLEDGYEMIINGESETIYGTLSVLTADNLSSHDVGGLKKSFSDKVFRLCRFCLGIKNEIQCFFCDSNFIPRTKEIHSRHVEALKTEEAKYFGMVYGLNNDSILNSLKYAHVIEALAPDAMHDLLEGVLPRTMCLMLHQLITEDKYFTIDTINHAFKNFKFGRGVSKPSKVTLQHLKRNCMRQSASQIWTIATCLPLMIGSLIPKDDPKWHCFTTLLEITSIVFKHCITEMDLEKLEFLVDEFLTTFKECFPTYKITPKMHFLVHYARLIRLLGPLGFLWTMRFEAKHSWFKHLAKKIGNYINLPKTLAIRHQVSQCFEFNTHDNKTESQKYEPSKFKTVTLKMYNQDNNRNHLDRYFGQISNYFSLNSSHDVHVRSIPWLKIGSLLFCVNETVVLCPLNGNVESAFGLIVAILCHNRKYGFLCKLFTTKSFDVHLQAFHVKERKTHIIVSPTKLSHYNTFAIHSPMHLTLNMSNETCLYIISKSDISGKIFNKNCFQ